MAKRKPRITLTKGLPGSGKSTWAREVQQTWPDITVLVSKDELRAMLHQSRYSKANEKFVCLLQETIVEGAILDGKDVIVHDTNLNPVHEQRFRDLAEAYGASFIVNDSFLLVPLEDCIARDLKRFDSVGKDVIEGMHHQWIQKGANVKAVEPPEHVQGGPEAIIVDLDGTMAIMGDRSPYAGEECHKDSLNVPVANVVSDWLCAERAQNSRQVIFCSGRDGKAREATLNWLMREGWGVDGDIAHLYMRAPDDYRKDAIIKEEIYREHIEGKYNVAFVLDDRDQVVSMWRSLGLTCLQVNYGNF